MFKKAFLTIFTIFAFLIVGQARAATTFSFYPLKISVKEGQTFRLTVSVDPQGAKNYTIKTSIKFPPDLAELSAWDFATYWMPLRKDGYESFSNTDGTLARTAGYPEGFDKKTVFGTATFLAKKTGTGVIEFSGEELALDVNSANVYGVGNKVTVTVQEINAETQKAAETPEEAQPPVGEQPPEEQLVAAQTPQQPASYRRILIIIGALVVIFILAFIVKRKKQNNR